MLPSMGICLQLGWLLVQEAWCICRSFFIASESSLTFTLSCLFQADDGESMAGMQGGFFYNGKQAWMFIFLRTFFF